MQGLEPAHETFPAKYYEKKAGDGGAEAEGAAGATSKPRKRKNEGAGSVPGGERGGLGLQSENCDAGQERVLSQV